MAVAVTVSSVVPSKLNSTTTSTTLEFTFTNTVAFTYAANSTVYYYVFVTDSTSGTAQTKDFIFTVDYTTSGTINADTPKTFELVNAEPVLVGPLTGTKGMICYKAA